MESHQPWKPTEFGHDMKKHFTFKSGHRNLNHGSFGTAPVVIRNKANEFREQCERRPCSFIKYEFNDLLHESRVALSKFLDIPVSTIVLVPNATTGINTVLRNIVFNERDEILHLDIIYGACAKTAQYICDTSQGKVRMREVGFSYPVEDSEIISGFMEAIRTSITEGFRPRVAIFDTISSNPGLRLPFEQLTALCREKGILSLIDAAHGIGQIELNLSTLDPDFLISNCHKWLYTPRGCALLYVPERNQKMMRSTLPTSHGFVPKEDHQPSKTNTEFISQFEFVGTTDNMAFLTIPDAIRWREIVCGGETKIQDWCSQLALRGGLKVADILGTRILDNSAHSFTKCFLVNILLPVNIPTSGKGSLVKQEGTSGTTVTDWTQHLMIDKYNTFMPVFPFQGSWWVRLSGQIYLEDGDFEWAGWTLKEICKLLEQQEFV